MAKFVMLNPTITVAGANLSTHVAAITVTTDAAEVATTAFGNTWVTSVGGLKSGSVAISFHTDYAAGLTNATLGPLLGSYGTVVASGTLGGVATSGTAVCLITTLTPIGGAVGDLATQDVTWPTSGTVTGFGL